MASTAQVITGIGATARPYKWEVQYVVKRGDGVYEEHDGVTAADWPCIYIQAADPINAAIAADKRILRKLSSSADTYCITQVSVVYQDNVDELQLAPAPAKRARRKTE